MSECFIVRHGQASFGCANYDQLSELGHQQAIWLGEYYRSIGMEFDHVLTGELVRHKETATGICRGLGLNLTEFDNHSGLNEFYYNEISEAYLKHNPQDSLPDEITEEEYFRLMKQALYAWTRNELPGLSEPWAQFEERVVSALDYIYSHYDKQKVLVVTSGGVMGVMLKNILKISSETMLESRLGAMNTAVHQVFFDQQDVRLMDYNRLPHLEPEDRRDFTTLI